MIDEGGQASIFFPSQDASLRFHEGKQAGLHQNWERLGYLGVWLFRWGTSVGEKLDLSRGLGVQSLLSVLLVSSSLAGLDPRHMVQSQRGYL